MKDYKVIVDLDSNPTDPRDYDNMGVILAYHRRYSIGDIDRRDRIRNPADGINGWGEFEQYLRDEEDAAVILPVYMYDHSGIVLSTTSFSCPWDSGRLGVIFCTNKMIKNEYRVDVITDKEIELATQRLVEEVKDYSAYVSGEVYQYTVLETQVCNLGHEHEKEVDFCGSYYSREDCEKDAEDALINIKNRNI
jgi:hypothetical protein